MGLGTPRRRVVFHQNDTAEITAWPNGYDRRPAPAEEIDTVTFSIKNPDDSIVNLPGTITTDGAGFLRYVDTADLGVYGWSARFEFVTGEIRSVSGTFKIVGPFDEVTGTYVEQIADEVWFRLEDMFDSDEGGPWLRDMTMKYFEPSKIERFISEGLFRINQTPPGTEFDLGYFMKLEPNTDPLLLGEMQASPDRGLVIQGTLLAVIRHLLRSYVEQPDVRGANVVFEDRRDYLQRWQSVYQIEKEKWEADLALWKRQFIGFGHSALLVHSKAGRVYRGGTNWRTRNAGRPGW